ncbi:hypothetical protein NSQ77_02940 [Oceanobacillus sp. FSL K6-2867]|uniref:hypothetical protein n=1 Tax=Oceanobacillus sp. FSL K6-2867 TaxID=2954748 RepID=UPI0030DC07D8
MKKLSKIGKVLAFIGVGVVACGIILMINDDGGPFSALSIPLIFIGVLIIIASILFTGNLSKKAFHINNFIILFLLLSFNLLASFGAGMSEGGIQSYMHFAMGLSFVIWGIFYFIQFVRPAKAWRTFCFLFMVTFLFFWQTGLGSSVGLMIFD